MRRSTAAACCQGRFVILARMSGHAHKQRVKYNFLKYCFHPVDSSWRLQVRGTLYEITSVKSVWFHDRLARIEGWVVSHEARADLHNSTSVS